MKNKGIAFKLFTITSIFFIIFITSTLLLQSIFFEKFYVSRKTKLLKTNLEQLRKTTALNTNNLGNTDLNSSTDSMYKFEETNNCKIALLTIPDRVTLMTQSTQEQRGTGKTQLIQDVLRQWLYMLDQNPSSALIKTTKVYNLEHPIYHTNNLVIITPILSNDTVKGLIFVVSPLQPVGEAAAVIKEYYVYIYAFAILIIVLLSLLYSKMISKPLININNAAMRMAELDFSMQCKVSSKDEIGNLATALNFLSEKLDTTLKELTAANISLSLDLEKEKRLEVMRKDFIAAVSHELKTPLSLIDGYAEGLRDGIAEEEDKDFYLQVIIEESEKMNSLISDMLALATLESGNYKLNETDFYIDELIDNIIKKYSPKFSEKNINLQTNFEENNLIVKGDSFRIEQVIINFLTNALKYTIEDHSIYISGKTVNKEVLIEVENEGDQIPEEDLENIWLKFYKIDRSRNRLLGGTGLGLSISKNILLLHESTYGVLNTEKGVKFYFTLKKSL
jgi:two-component system sensor histidine kinase VanS